ncbi:MAG: prepilin-type N-terminal cleavage/methylation domain-containing protein [Bacillota bacterium]
MSVLSVACGRVGPRRKGFTLVEMLVVVVILAVLAAVVIAVIPRAAQRSREAALRTQLAELQGAVDRYTAERNLPPRAGELSVPGQEFLQVWVQEGKRRLSDVAQPVDSYYHVWTLNWYALLEGGYLRAWPPMQVLGPRNVKDPQAAFYGGTGDLVYGLFLASVPDAGGNWWYQGTYRACAIPLAQLAQSVNDGSRLSWALDEYRDRYGRFPTNAEIYDYASLRQVVRPWVQLPPSEAELPWRYVSYGQAEGAFRLVLRYWDRNGYQYTIYVYPSGVNVQLQ